MLVLAAAAGPAMAADDAASAVVPAPLPQSMLASRPDDGAHLTAPKLTPQLLAAYVSRQQALKHFSFAMPSPQSGLSDSVLSAYVAKRNDTNPALTAINSLESVAPIQSSISGAMLEKYAVTRFVPTGQRVKAADHEQLCLAEAIYNEARGEPESGQWAVANVVINRAFSSRYPSTICGVVFQNASAGPHRCQFSFACDGRPDIGTEPGPWARAQRIALAAYHEFQRGKRPEVIPNSVLFYHARSVSPGWADTYRQVAAIGDHLFYAPM